MALKEKVQAVSNGAVAVAALVTTFYTVVELMVFLSDPNYSRSQRVAHKDFWISATWSLFIDQLLLSTFILQHSVLALPEVKKWLSSWNLHVLQRSVYAISTSLTLQIILRYWHHVPEAALWSINTNSRLYWWTFITLHAFAWAIIYVGTICMDVTELLGIKQVYYNIQGFHDPSSYKSRELQRLYAHMRHPSFIGFLIIFWAVPFMSLDRLLLAGVWSVYMYLAWNTDQSDYRYQEVQFARKFHELNYVQ